MSEKFLNPVAEVCDLLEDFDWISSPAGAILLPARLSNTVMRRNLSAALSAAILGLRSVDSVLRKLDHDAGGPPDDPERDRYQAIYVACRDHVRQARGRLRPSDDVPVRDSAIAASVALVRLVTGFQAVHLLHRLGYNHEGDAVARQMLEQIAWAYTAALDDKPAEFERLRPSKCIGKLSAAIPSVGRTYGGLSESAHPFFADHFLVKDDGHVKVRMQWMRFVESAEILVTLADLWVAVWEWCNRESIDAPVSITSSAELTLRPDREFRVQYQRMIDELREIGAD